VYCKRKKWYYIGKLPNDSVLISSRPKTTNVLKFTVILSLAVIIADIAIGRYGSWLVFITECFLSALLGLSVIIYVLRRYRACIHEDFPDILEGNWSVCEDYSPEKYLLMLGGGLLVLPGCITDAAGLVLLLPIVRRLSVFLLKKI
jgi:hypothetical protein